MRILSQRDVRDVVGAEDAFATVEAAWREYGRYRALSSVPPSLGLAGPADGAATHRVKGAVSPTLGAAGFRIATYPGSGPVDRRHVHLVLDYVTGEVVGLVDEEWLHGLRAATQAVVAAARLARRDAKVVGIVGAGRIARELFPGLALRFPLEDVRVAAVPRDNADAYARDLSATGVPVRAVASAEEAIRGADIVVTITTAKAPMVEPGWLAPGALLVSLGGVHEVRHAVLAECDRFVVDDFDYALSRGDMGAWVSAGETTPEALRQRLDADIGEIVAGLKPGRQGPDERILAIIQGLAACDVAMAKLALDRAAEQGRGTVAELPVMP
ncbi:MAG: hypothetical protein WD270_08795 [Acetobacterales bacterium]